MLKAIRGLGDNKTIVYLVDYHFWKSRKHLDKELDKLRSKGYIGSMREALGNIGCPYHQIPYKTFKRSLGKSLSIGEDVTIQMVVVSDEYLPNCSETNYDTHST